MKTKKYYGVMALHEYITAKDHLGNEANIKIDELAGYIPVYKTKKQATKVAGDKFKVFEIETPKE